MRSTAKTSATLPVSYREIERIDLKENKKLFLLVNVLSLVIAIPFLALGFLVVPISSLMQGGSSAYWLRIAVILGGLLIYIVLHEAVHGIFMKAFSGVKPHYGMSLTYAYAGSDAYFNRRHYIIIALAPIVIWGLVLAALCFLLPRIWFWAVYFIQLMNLSGAAGDLYVTVRMLRMPADILVRDTGVAMTVYSAEQA